MLVKELLEKLNHAESEVNYIDFYHDYKEDLFQLGPFKDENLDMMKKYLDKEVDKFSFQSMCIEYIEYLEDGMLPPMTNVLWIEVK